MSIQHVASVLDSRNPDLSGTRKLVLITLANRTDMKGICWPSQDLIAGECGISLRAVSDHLKALDEAGYITRRTTHLGQGNGSRTTYKLHLDALTKTLENSEEVPRNAPEDFARADFARAKNVVCTGSRARVTNHQEPSLSITNVIDTREMGESLKSEKAKPVKRGPARTTSLKEDWQPSVMDLAYATKKGLTSDEIRNEADRFRGYYRAKGTRWKDWGRVWQNWINSDFGPLARKAKQHAPAKPSRDSELSDAFDRIADRFDAEALSGRTGRELYEADLHSDSANGSGQVEIFDSDGHAVGWK